jgi:beta-lactamase superfamily II metal-dependent hydrolase
MSVYSFNNAFIINNISYYHQSETQSLSENNRSLVLLFKLFNIRFLITGDIEIIGLQLMEKDFQKIDKIELIQIPHHGSKTGFFLPILNK